MVLPKGRAIQKLMDEFCPSARTDAANECAAKYHPDYKFPIPDFGATFHRQSRCEIAYLSFLAGADWAMGGLQSELLDENQALHTRLMSLLAQFGLKPCEDCNADGFDLQSMTECKVCSGTGWLPNVHPKEK